MEGPDKEVLHCVYERCHYNDIHDLVCMCLVYLVTSRCFGPLWEVLKTMCEKLVMVHSKFVEVLGEISKEIGEYHHSQKEKFKSRVSWIDTYMHVHACTCMSMYVHACPNMYMHVIYHNWLSND